MTTATELWAYARGRVHNAQGTAADEELKVVVDDALAMIAGEYEWPWYFRESAIALQEPYSTGTVALTREDATVTLSGGTWPSWAADGILLVGTVPVPVASRTSDSVIELAWEWAEAAQAAASYKLVRMWYPLPDNFFGFHGLLPTTASWIYPDPVDPATWYSTLDTVNGGGSQTPCYYTIKGQQLGVWPYPSSYRQLRYTYQARPAALASGSDEADWDPAHLYLLRRAIDLQALIQHGNTVQGEGQTYGAALGVVQDLYRKALGRAVATKRAAPPPRTGTPRNTSRTYNQRNMRP